MSAFGVAVFLNAAGFANTVRAEDAVAKEPLVLELPAPTLKGTPEQLPEGPNIEPNSDKPRPALLVPKGVKNVALNKPVTTSVKPFTGEANQLTDGKKEAMDFDTVEMKKGVQWIQVDLGEPFAIQAIAIWHDHRYIQVIHDVIVQASDDPEFKTGVTTLFNNDTDNTSGLGIGADREYFERQFGRVFDAKGVKARYVRGYTKGSNLSALNCWQEIEVYALPDAPKPKAAITTPTATTIAEPQPPVVPPPALPAVAPVSTESKTAAAKPAEAPAPPTVAQTAPAPEATSSTPAQAPTQPAVAAPVAARFNWTGPLLAGLALLAVALGVIYALTRNSHPAPLAKAK